MRTPSEDITKTWVRHKGLLMRSRPKASRFSFLVCTAMVVAMGLGFLGGFVSAFFTLSDNYSTVYEGLLSELETAQRCVEKEKAELMVIKQVHQAKAVDSVFEPQEIPTTNSQMHDQAVFSVFERAVDMLQKNNKNGGCAELRNITNLNGYNGEWKNKAWYLINKDCQ